MPVARRAEGASVSGTHTAAATSSTTPAPARTTNRPRQSVRSQQPPADRRREDRAQRHGAHERGVDLGRLQARPAIAHDRPREHDARRAAEPLHEAQEVRGRRSTGAAAQPSDATTNSAEPHEQRPPAAERVAQRPGDQLAEREPDEAGGRASAAPATPRRRARRPTCGSPGRYRSVVSGPKVDSAPRTTSSAVLRGAGRRPVVRAGDDTLRPRAGTQARLSHPRRRPRPDRRAPREPARARRARGRAAGVDVLTARRRRPEAAAAALAAMTFAIGRRVLVVDGVERFGEAEVKRTSCRRCATSRPTRRSPSSRARRGATRRPRRSSRRSGPRAATCARRRR